ncbi:MAG: hypothetical protein ACOC0X_01335 [Halobacteriota archaeon]
METASTSSVERALAINVGANTGLPGVRAPVGADGRFAYWPIPEREPCDEPVPTYADLGLAVPAALADTPVHLDPSFRDGPYGESYTYGDEHPVKAAPLSELTAGDELWFYATLEPDGAPPPGGPPDWGAYLIGRFRLAVDPVDPECLEDHDPAVRETVRRNAHFRRVDPDAEVVVLGEPATSALLARAVPLSAADAGRRPGPLVREHSLDSGRGPWWRRPLRFDAEGAAALREAVAAAQPPGQG